MSSSSSTPIPSREEIEAWDTDDIIQHFSSTVKNFNDGHAKILQDNEIIGQVLRDITVDGLMATGMGLRPAILISKEIDRITGRTAGTTAATTLKLKEALTSDESKSVCDEIITKESNAYKTHNVNMQEVEKYQKENLGPFYPNRPLPYAVNPDRLSLPMFGQVLDKQPTASLGNKRTFSEIVESDTRNKDKYIITMVARSGAGKTASVVALARKHFVIYAVCTILASQRPDFNDQNFSNLASDVEDLSRILKMKYDLKSKKSIIDYDKDLKEHAIYRVQIEFLARKMLLLLLFKKNPQLEPENFFREQMNRGSKTIMNMVQYLKKYGSETIRDMLIHVDRELEDFLGGRGLVITLDEAYIAENSILANELISPSAISKGEDIFDNKNEVQAHVRCGFLTPLCLALGGMSATLVVLGTAFSLMNVDRVYSATAKPDQMRVKITNFPSCDEADVGKVLSALLDMSNCDVPPEKRRKLSGRFRFTTYVIAALAEVDRSITNKQAVLDEALRLAERKAKKDIRAEVAKLLTGPMCKNNAHFLCRMVIAFKLADGRIAFARRDEADLVNMSICALKENDDGYFHVLDEPLVAEVIEEELKKTNIDPDYVVYLEELNSILTSLGPTATGKGNILERLIGRSLKRFNGTILADLPFLKNIQNIPGWCKTIKLQVDGIGMPEELGYDEGLVGDIKFFEEAPLNKLVYPDHNTRPDLMMVLSKVGQDEYWIGIGSKFFSSPIKTTLNEANTRSSNIRFCFYKADGTPNDKLGKYRNFFESFGYPGKIKGTLRIHFVFPSVEGGTPPGHVDGEDVLIYIDCLNMDTFFDESIIQDDEDRFYITTLKKMIRFVTNSKAEEQQPKCNCKATKRANNQCSCYKNSRECTFYCGCQGCQNRL